MRLLAGVLVTGWLLSGCVMTVSSPRALVPFKGFAELPQDGQVWVEPGYESYGRKVAELLPLAEATVEQGYGRRFRLQPRVYVCGTEACFKRYVLTPRLSAAVVPDNRLILSPNLNGKESERLKPLLIHELAHLHLGQYIGHYDASIPIWFHEGLATLIAHGGGAEFATDDEAYEAAKEGRTIDLRVRDTPDMRHKASSFNMNVYEFYRQSYLLVEKLKQMNPKKFSALLSALEGNQDFEVAFWDIYGSGPETILGTALARNSDADDRAAAPAKPEN